MYYTCIRLYMDIVSMEKIIHKCAFIMKNRKVNYFFFFGENVYHTVWVISIVFFFFISMEGVCSFLMNLADEYEPGIDSMWCEHIDDRRRNPNYSFGYDRVVCAKKRRFRSDERKMSYPTEKRRRTDRYCTAIWIFSGRH